MSYIHASKQDCFSLSLPRLNAKIVQGLDAPELFKMFLQKASRWDIGQLDVTLPNGETYRIGGHKPGPYANIQIKNVKLANRVLGGGVLAFCEGYMDQDWHSTNPAAVMRWFLLNQKAQRRSLLKENVFSRLASFLAHKLRRNHKSGSKKNISAHYDLGNDFYEYWLDQTMTYSSAIFENNMSLEQAQQNKYKLLAERIGLKAEHHVLEIGCGWGGFAEYAAKTIGARVTSITISEQQYHYAQQRIKATGLSDKVEILFKDYRDLDGQFDRIVSIEMIEAVGEEYWPTYFETLNARLKPGGKVGIQSITIDENLFENYRRKGDFIQMHIFPGGMLPTKTLIQEHAQSYGLKQQDMFSFGTDYAETLRRWNDQFQNRWSEIQSLGYDTRFKRMWELYLMYCEAGFDAGTIDVIHATFEKES